MVQWEAVVIAMIELKSYIQANPWTQFAWKCGLAFLYFIGYVFPMVVLVFSIESVPSAGDFAPWFVYVAMLISFGIVSWSFWYEYVKVRPLMMLLSLSTFGAVVWNYKIESLRVLFFNAINREMGSMTFGFGLGRWDISDGVLRVLEWDLPFGAIICIIYRLVVCREKRPKIGVKS